MLNRGYVYENEKWSPLPELPIGDINSHACGFVRNYGPLGDKEGILITGGASTEEDPLLSNFFLDWSLRDKVIGEYERV